MSQTVTIRRRVRFRTARPKQAPCHVERTFPSGTELHGKNLLVKTSKQRVMEVGLLPKRSLDSIRRQSASHPLPLFHLAAILPLISVIWAGACFITDTHFDADSAIVAIGEEQPTILFTAFPLIMAALVNHPEFDVSNMPQLRLVNNVAPPDQLKKNMEILPHAVHVSAYGLTEASGVSCNGSSDEDDDTRR